MPLNNLTSCRNVNRQSQDRSTFRVKVIFAVGQLLLRYTRISSLKPFYFTIYNNKIIKQRIVAVEFDVS